MKNRLTWKCEKKNRNLELWHIIKCAHTFCGPEKSSIYKKTQSIKQFIKDKIYHNINYTNICFFFTKLKEFAKKRPYIKGTKKLNSYLLLQK